MKISETLFAFALPNKGANATDSRTRLLLSHMIDMVHTGKFLQNSRTFEGLLNDLPAVFKDYKIKKNIDLHNEILLQEC